MKENAALNRIQIPVLDVNCFVFWGLATGYRDLILKLVHCGLGDKVWKRQLLGWSIEVSIMTSFRRSSLSSEIRSSSHE